MNCYAPGRFFKILPKFFPCSTGDEKMACFSEEELDDIRRNTDIVTLIESYGTKLKERPKPN